MAKNTVFERFEAHKKGLAKLTETVDKFKADESKALDQLAKTIGNPDRVVDLQINLSGIRRQLRDAKSVLNEFKDARAFTFNELVDEFKKGQDAINAHTAQYEVKLEKAQDDFQKAIKEYKAEFDTHSTELAINGGKYQNLCIDAGYPELRIDSGYGQSADITRHMLANISKIAQD